MEACSVHEYLCLIEQLKKNYTYTEGIAIFGTQTYTPHFIYRGHSNHKKYKLLPGIFRERVVSPGCTTTEYSQLEFNILNDFISEACRFVKDIPVEDIPAWLEIAQHFGVPTRLLDFTENPLVALYFSCIGSPKEDATVWILNEPVYNKKFFLEGPLVLTIKSKQMVSKIVSDEIVYQDYQVQHYNNPDYIQWPWIYKPHYHEERMNLQSSIFMIWGADRRPLTEFVSTNEFMTEETVTNQANGLICNIIIPANRKHELLNQLNLCGINEKFIYPGMDGIGRYINQKYSSRN